MQRLKDSFPKHFVELSLIMADYYRRHGAYSKAWDEYQMIEDRSKGLHPHPVVYLHEADTLVQLDKPHQAAERLYVVLANEAAYLSQRDEEGNPRPQEEMERNQRIVQEAYLTLGRLFNDRLSEIGRAAPVSTIPAGGVL
jgi:hypothetical protein